MHIFKDIDRVRITCSVKSVDNTLDKDVIVPAGSAGTVVAVLGDPDRPSAYLVEFCVGEMAFALATVEAEFVEAE